ncbi:TonB family protein [Labrys monachus]|uniref:Protein TonB n=1 Tax=Labrys monachus TaxID=217067 RepID=A0ABU0FAD9_9HYPH|nr:TonB family protein [Labrys monachus]MDQ0391584.1 protein TonB [Labrys monachus]
MTSADLIGNRRSGMIATAAALHLAAVAGAWIAIPPGTVTRADQPIEASFAPMPSADQVNAKSTWLAQEVRSAVEQADPAPEETARVVKDDAAAAAPVPAATQPLQPDRAEAERAPAAQEPVRSETARLEPAPAAPLASAEGPAAPSAPAPTTQASAVPAPAASPVADVVVALASQEDFATPAAVPQADSGDVTPALATEAVPEPSKASQPATARPATAGAAEPKPARPSRATPRKKTASQPVKAAAEQAPKAKPAEKTVARRPQLGGAGAVSDVGVADDARRSGATAKNYDAVILAQIRSRLRFPASARDRGVEGTAAVSFVVSGQGAVGTVHLARSSNDMALDAAALALVRGLSLPPPPYHPYVRTVPVRYALR